MQGLRIGDFCFEWDDKKAEINLKKHGIKFEEAINVFEDPNQFSRFDRVENGEDRWHTIGTIKGQMVVLVVHLIEDLKGYSVVRIISARPTTKTERKIYDNQRYF